jgi:hypothetical protein
MAYKPRKDIKVPESYIQKLRDAGSKKASLEKYGSSTDPKMREALRRFYGASAPAPLPTAERAANKPKGSLPKTVSQAKPKSNAAPKAPGRVGPGQVVQTRRSAAPTSKAPNRESANKAAANKAAGNKRAMQIASVVPIVRGARMVAGSAKVVSGIARGKDAAKFYGDTARNMSTRAQKAGEMRSTQQAVAAASKKKASGLQGAATRKANAKAAEKARLERNAKAAATRAKNAKAKAAAAKRAGKAGK